MSKNKKSSSKELLISINKAAYILNMSEETLLDWLNELKIKTKLDSHGFKCIDYNNDFKKLIHNPIRKEKSQKDIREYLSYCASADTNKINEHSESILDNYKEYIAFLERILSEMTKNCDLLNDENPINAAMLIFIKIINMCNMFIISIKEGYNSALILVRTIDEANTLAQYFVFLQDTSTCKNDLERWYKLDKSPSAAECREKVTSALSKDFLYLQDQMHNLSDELYSVKSKAVHHSFRDCADLLSLGLENDLIIVKDICYKSSDVFRKNEIVEYFESIINNVMQGFIICFKELLKKDDLDKLVVITTEMSMK